MIDTKALRQKVLDLAIRGKLVPQDPNDEPASVLLERIRAQKQQMVKDGKLKAKDIKNDTVIFVGEDNLHYEKFTDGSVKCIEDEIPFDLPDGWVWCRVHTVASVKGGKRIPKGYSVIDTPTNHAYIRVTDMKNQTVLVDDLKYITDDVFSQISAYTISKDDLYVTIAGTIGSVGEVPDILDGMNLTENAVKICNISINKKYLCYVLSSEFVQKQFRYQTHQVTMAKLALERILDTLIPISPLKEQDQITARIQEANKQIDHLNESTIQIGRLINKAKSKILDLAIRGQLVPHDPADEPASVLLDRIRAEKEELIKAGKIKRDKKESVIFKGEDNSYYEKIGDTVTCIDEEIPFDLPIDWQFVRLKDICELISGRDLQPNEYNSEHIGIPYITGASNFSDDGVCIERWTNEPQVVSELGDLLLTCKGTVGKMSFNTFGKAHIARQIMAIRNTFHINDKYLKICLEFYIEKIKDSAKGLIPGISRDDMLYLILPIPSSAYQSTIVNTIDQINKTICDIEASLS